MNRVRDPIDRHLERLTPETASAGFTARVMEHLEGARAERPKASSVRQTWAVATASALAIAIVVFLVRANPADRNRLEDRSIQLADMRRQHALLKQELGSLRTRAQDTAPVIYLGSVDEIDYVWDLSPLLDRQTGRAVPASTRQNPTAQIQRELP